METNIQVPWSHPLDGLPLQYATSSEWPGIALAQLDLLLADHAHCEQKAASTAVAMIGRFPAHPGLPRRMLALAHEEMRHFRQVLDLLEERGAVLSKPQPDEYVRKLRDWSFRHRGGLGPLGDLLLTAAFVEARSCERFRMLAERLLSDPAERDLGMFYLRLADAEGRHWELFRDLALEADEEKAVTRRLAEMGKAEAEIAASQPLLPRMH